MTGWARCPSALIVLMVVLVWVQIGYPVVIFMAALQRVDPELYEAAELDGANWFQRFTAITMSIIRPEIFVVTLTSHDRGTQGLRPGVRASPAAARPAPRSFRPTTPSRSSSPSGTSATARPSRRC